MNSANKKAVPFKKGMVRVQTMSGYWEFMPVVSGGENSGKVKVTYELSLDPGGNLPKWLVNTLAVDLPFHTLKNLRQPFASGKMSAPSIDIKVSSIHYRGECFL